MRKLATIQRVSEIQPIENADTIERIRIKDWWCVSKKDQFKIGDFCVYFEIDSLLPSKLPVFQFLAKGTKEKTMNLDGKEYKGFRLKTIKLRGVLSQGLILPIKSEGWNFEDHEVDDEVSEFIGVVKYEPPIPAEMSGKMKGFFPGFIPKTDEERIQNIGEILSGFYVTEKLDGSSVTFFKKDGVFGVCTRNLELLESEGNTQWRLAREMGLPEKLPDNFAIQGELIGEGVQGNPLKIKGQKIYFYNAYNILSAQYLDFGNFKNLMVAIGVETVPIIDENFAIPNNVAGMLEYAEGKSKICPDSEREGVVVRPKTEMMYKGQRFSFKAISNKYLLDEK